MQSKWSRREEADFYRVVSSFGVERDMHTGQYKWATFRSLAKLDKKFDETLTEYFIAFYHMCMTVCKRFRTPEEGKTAFCVYLRYRILTSVARDDISDVPIRIPDTT